MTCSTPSKKYLKLLSRKSVCLSKPTPKLIVLDLNCTLLHRSKKKRTRGTLRPYLKEFLQYLFNDDTDGTSGEVGESKGSFSVMVWSSARPQTVDALVNKAFGRYRGRLIAIWSRNKFGLNEYMYNRKVSVIKNLEIIWNELNNQHDDSSVTLPSTESLNDSSLSMSHFAYSPSTTPRSPLPTDEAINAISSPSTTPRSPLHTDKTSISSTNIIEKLPHITDLDTINGTSLFTWDQTNTILIDDTPSKAVLQPYNAIHLCPFDSPGRQSKDKELMNIIEYLEILKYQDNVSAYIKEHAYVPTEISEKADSMDLRVTTSD